MRRSTKLVIAFVAVLVVAAAVALAGKLPYSQSAVIARLEKQTGAHVSMSTFRQTWFPLGFVAERVKMSHPNGTQVIIAAITVNGSYSGLLHSPKKISSIDARGVHVILPWGKPAKWGGSGSGPGLSIGTIDLRDARIDILSATPGKPPLTFDVHQMRLEHLARGNPVTFHVALQNPRPSGYIRAHGQFGPLDTNHAGETPVSGAFTFQHADLTLDHGVTGSLDASGEFHGRLQSIECAGTADVPRFQVFGSSHAVHIASRFRATVDATHGDAILQEIVSRFNATTVAATGTVMGTPGRPGKTTTLDVKVQDGRVEDLLLLFTHAPTSSMNGAVSLQSRFTIPPGPPDFLTRIKIDGKFEIAHASFTNPKTQEPINKLSASAKGESGRELKHDDPPLAAARISASVSDRNGVAAVKNTVFEAPGIRGHLAGTFALHDKAIDMKGVLETTGKMADTTSGMKSAMLKILSPLWPRHASVESVPFHIGGKASAPAFRLQLHR